MKQMLTKLGMALLFMLSFQKLSAYDFELDGIYYNIISNVFTGEISCEVTWCGKDPYKGDIKIPAKVSYGGKDFAVTNIGDYAFYRCGNLTSVEIPNSVTAIGRYAFELCTSLTSVAIPNSVTEIDDHVFSGCSNLTSVEIPNSVTAIGRYAFELCTSLTSVAIPNSVTEIDDHVFSGCSSLTSVEIPNSVIEIGSYAFSDCSSLASVSIPNSVTKIASYAFYRCSSLTSVDIPNSVTEIGSSAFSGCSSLTSVDIPNSVTEIDDYVFSGCSSLTSVDIPNSVTEIGLRAFSGCISLMSVEIPNSVIEIGSSAFSDCSSLTSVIISDSVTWIEKNTFLNCSSLMSVEIPSSVTYLKEGAFKNCTSLKYLSLKATEIPIKFTNGYNQNYSQFASTSVEELHLERSIEFSYYESGSSYLFGFDEVKKLYVTDNVSIGLIWGKCEDLEELTIGENVELSSCSSKSQLKSITINSNNPPKCPLFTKLQYVNIKVYVPKGSLASYKADHYGWANFRNLQEIGNESGVEDISEARDIVETGRFDINGMPVDDNYKGIVIIRYSDGSTVKRIVR